MNNNIYVQYCAIKKPVKIYLEHYMLINLALFKLFKFYPGKNIQSVFPLVLNYLFLGVV